MLDPRRAAPLDPACRLTVVIPARNEEARIGEAVAALARQREPDGCAVDPHSFDVVVFCNGCVDATAARAWRAAREHPELALSVLVASERGFLDVGQARGAALDLATRRFLAAGRRGGILASTDADTIVAPDWVAWTLREMRSADAVGGYVRVAERDRERMLAPLRLIYDRELAYRRLLGEIENLLDPRSYDPGPRHDSFVGASFAVSVAAYITAGGLPRLPFHEDVAFARALDRVDARVRHSYRVRCSTSARTSGRVEGGFGTFLGELARRSERHETLPVKAAAASIESARARRHLRSAWRGDEAQYAAAAALLGIGENRLTSVAREYRTFGSFWQALEPEARQRMYEDEPIEDAIAAFRRVLGAGAAIDVASTGALDTG
jgi:Glycosyltransferase like family 2